MNILSAVFSYAIIYIVVYFAAKSAMESVLERRENPVATFEELKVFSQRDMDEIIELYQRKQDVDKYTLAKTKMLELLNELHDDGYITQESYNSKVKTLEED